MVYERFVKQLDGCTYCSGGLNCTAASMAMFLYRASQGRIIVNSCDVRRRTGDKSGGLRLEQVQDVAEQFGITGTRLLKPGKFDDVIAYLQTGRYGAIIQYDYSPIAPSPYDAFDSRFTGGHAAFGSTASATTVRIGDPGADGRRSTIPKGFQNYPISLLRKATGMLQLDDTGSDTMDSEYGPGHVFALLTPADPLSTRYRAVITGYTRLYTRPGGTLAGAVTKASYIVTRSKVDGLWWYTIVSKADGSATGSKGRAFKPTSVTHITPI